MHISSDKRNATLDSIRGIAILLVVLHHAFWPENISGHNLFFVGLWRMMERFHTGGWCGVDLFFVMSGFLISGLLFKEYTRIGNINLKRFLIRRSFKVYPSFIAFLLIASSVDIYLSRIYPAMSFPISAYMHDFFFLHNYLGGRWGQTWSLDVEEFFYLSFPLFLLYLIKRKKITLKYFIQAYFFLVVVGLISRFFANYHQEYSYQNQFTLTHLRLEALFFGVLLSYVTHFEPVWIQRLMKYSRIVIPVCMLTVLINFFIWHGGMRTVITLGANPVAFGILMIYAIHKKILTIRPLAFIGLYSYNIYLWHYPFYLYSKEIIDVLNVDVTRLSGYLSFLGLYLTAGIGLGVLFTKLIENPFLKIRDKYYPSLKNRVGVSVKNTEMVPLTEIN